MYKIQYRIFDIHRIVGYILCNPAGKQVSVSLDTFKNLAKAGKILDIGYDKRTDRVKGLQINLNKYPAVQFKDIKNPSKVETKTVKHTKQSEPMQNHEKAERYLAKCKILGRYDLQFEFKRGDRVVVVGVNKNLETITIPDFVTDFTFKLTRYSDGGFIIKDSWSKDVTFQKVVWDNVNSNIKTVGMFCGLKQKTLEIHLSHPENLKDLSYMFLECESLEKISGLENLQNIQKLEQTFRSCGSLKDFQFLQNWNISNVTQLKDCFYGSGIETLQCLQDWDVSNVETMYGLFSSCQNLTDIDTIKKWNTHKLKSAREMFRMCKHLENIESISFLNFNNVEDITGFFLNCYELKDIQSFFKLKMPKVTQLNIVFSGCENLESLKGASQLDVQNIENMEETFSNCDNLRDISELQNWNTQKVQKMGGLFQGCKQLSCLDGLQNWDIRQLDSLSFIFGYCRNLTNINALKNWKTSNILRMTSVFRDCERLKDFQSIQGWDVQRVKQMESMFLGCEQLTTLDYFRYWKTPQLEVTTYMFLDCSLVSLRGMKNWDTQKIRRSLLMFKDNLKISDNPELLSISGRDTQDNIG